MDAQIQERYKKKNFLHKNKKLQSLALYSKLNKESWHINTVNRTKNYHSTLILLCLCQYLYKKQAFIHAVSLMSIFELRSSFQMLQIADGRIQSAVSSARGSWQGPGKNSGGKAPKRFWPFYI